MPELNVRIPASLTITAGGESEIRLEADTLAERLRALLAWSLCSPVDSWRTTGLNART